MSNLVTYMTALVPQSLVRPNDEGQDLLEYALLVALIAIVAIAAVTLAGQQVDAIFTQIANGI
jgi:Flp pilus assembly pilin Flp